MASTVYCIAGNFYCKKDKLCHWCKAHETKLIIQWQGHKISFRPGTAVGVKPVSPICKTEKPAAPKTLLASSWCMY